MKGEETEYLVIGDVLIVKKIFLFIRIKSIQLKKILDLIIKNLRLLSFMNKLFLVFIIICKADTKVSASFILYEPDDLDYLSFPVPPFVGGGVIGDVNPVTIGVTKTVPRISIC